MIELRDYQTSSVEFLTARARALVHAPAGSGKTIIGATAVARAQLADWAVMVLWLANTIEQRNQAEAALLTELGPAAKGITVSCWQAQPDLSQFNLIVVDEAHHATAPMLRWMVSQAKPEARIWGLTATPWSEDSERNAVMKEIFKETFQIERDLLVERGHLSRAKVVVLSVDAKDSLADEIESAALPEIKRRCARLGFLRGNPKVYKAKCAEAKQRAIWEQAQQIGIVHNDRRNAKTVEVANNHVQAGDSVLILVGLVEHAERLAEQIPGAVAIYSAVGVRARRNGLAGFADGSIPCVVATSLADEGLDVPRANVLLLVSGGRSANKLEQRTGRVLRAFQDKTHGTIYDFADEGYEMLRFQAYARRKVYRNLGYEFGERPSTPPRKPPTTQLALL